MPPSLDDTIDAAVPDACPPRAPKAVKPYDFTRPDKISREQSRALETLFADAARGMAAPLSALLRMEMAVELTGVGEAHGRALLEGPPASTVAVLRIAPLEGRAMVVLDPALALAMVDRLLGGPGRALGEARPLTAIEKPLVQRVVDCVAEAVAQAWRPLAALRPETEEVDDAAHAAPSEEGFVTADFTVTMGDAAGAVRFALPVSSLSPVLSRLSAQYLAAASGPRRADGFADTIEHSLDRAPLEMTIPLGRAEITVRELLDLQVGDMVRLDRKMGADLEAMIGSQIKFYGQPGQAGRRLGLQITHVLNGEESE